MASLMDFYQPPSGTPAPFHQANTALGSARAENEAGLQQFRLERDFSQRSLPQLASSEAAGGRFHSTGAQRRAAWLTQDVGEQAGDIQRNLGYQLADMTRGGVLAQLGVNV